MAVTAKIGVDASGFKTGVEQAKAALKSLDASLKVNEASFKAGGNAEIYMQQKMQLLNDKMQKQHDLVKQLQAGLDKMRSAGVNPLSVEYQRLETQMLNAQTAMLETKTSIDSLDGSEEKAVKSTSALNDGLNSIGKKMSLDQVISGINKITDGLEKAAKKAIQLGTEIWTNIVDTARVADDYSTLATVYGLDPETVQKQIKVFDTMAETSIDAYQKARLKINKAVNDPSTEQVSYLQQLGLIQGGKSDDSVTVLVNDAENALWEVGKRLRAMVESGALSKDDADLMAQSLFGRNFKELNPLFEMGEEGFKAAVDAQSAATAEAIKNDADLSDSIIMVQKDLETFKLEILGGIAPAIQIATDSLSKLINGLTEYAQSDEGQALLQSMGESIAALFEGLANVDPESVIKKFKGVFDALKDGFTWIVDNKESIFDALKFIAGGFALLKVSETVLSFAKLAQGLTGLFGGSGAVAGSGAAAAGSGLNLGGIGSWFSSKFGGLSKYIPTTMAAWNAAPVADWFMNNTYLGQNIRNTGDLGGSISATFEKMKSDLASNVQGFGASWAGVFNEIGKLFNDPNKQASKNLLFDPQQLQSEFDQLFSEPVPIPAEPELPEDAADDVAKQIGVVVLPAKLQIMGGLIGLGGGGANLQNLANNNKMLYTHANGLSFVPWDGYPALLHRGERIMPASVNRNYTANSNLYVENMNMSNGLDADALVAKMRAQNRRVSAGFGG